MCEVAVMWVACFVTYLLQGYRPPAIAEATLVAATTYTSPSPVVGSFGGLVLAGDRALPLRCVFRGFGLVVSERRG